MGGSGSATATGRSLSGFQTRSYPQHHARGAQLGEQLAVHIAPGRAPAEARQAAHVVVGGALAALAAPHDVAHEAEHEAERGVVVGHGGVGLNEPGQPGPVAPQIAEDEQRVGQGRVALQMGEKAAGAFLRQAAVAGDGALGRGRSLHEHAAQHKH